MDNIELSIIVPCFNEEKYIRRCLESIVRQTFNNYEIIVINDGSTDNSLDIINNFFIEHKEIRHQIIDQDNIGIALSRIVGIKKANGTYIGFMDGDDWIEQDYYRMLMETMYNYNADLVCSGFVHHIYNKTTVCDNGDSLKNKKIDSMEALDYVLNRKGIYQYPWNKVYKKEIISETSYPKEKFAGSDTLLTIFYLNNCSNVAVADTVGYHYCVNKNSLTQSAYSDLYRNKYLIFDDLYKKELKHNKPYIKSLDRYLILEYMSILVAMVKKGTYDKEIKDGILNFVKERKDDYIRNCNDGIQAKVATMVACVNFNVFALMSKIVVKLREKSVK